MQKQMYISRSIHRHCMDSCKVCATIKASEKLRYGQNFPSLAGCPFTRFKSGRAGATHTTPSSCTFWGQLTVLPLLPSIYTFRCGGTAALSITGFSISSRGRGAQTWRGGDWAEHIVGYWFLLTVPQNTPRNSIRFVSWHSWEESVVTHSPTQQTR